MINNSQRLILGVLLSCVLLPIFALVFIYLYPWQTLVLLNENDLIKVTNKTVCAGALMHYENKIDKLHCGTCVVKRNLTNSYVIPYEPIEPPEKHLGVQVVPGFLHVPRYADPGSNWQMNWTAECPRTFLERKMIISGRSEKFTVINCGDKP